MGLALTDWHDLAVQIEERRRQGQRIVTTNGVFDLLHVGHVPLSIGCEATRRCSCSRR